MEENGFLYRDELKLRTFSEYTDWQCFDEWLKTNNFPQSFILSP